MEITITGAAGTVGRQAREGLSDHDLTLVTHREHDGVDSEVLDLDDRDALIDAFAGSQVVVHLAANASPRADWQSVSGTNIDGTYNVYEAAQACEIERVVFASSNHVHHMHNVADPGEPETTRADASTIDHDDPYRPTSYYGVSKIAGEALGSYYADRRGIEVVNARIGWLLTEAQLADSQSNPEAEARHARAMWLSPRDCRRCLRRTVEAPLPENPLTINVLSRNQDRYFSITNALRAIDYRPRDDSADVLDRD